MQCTNHLKQLALAFHSHHSAHSILPSAGGPAWNVHMTFDEGRPAIAPYQQGGWGFQILPYIEQQSVWTGGSATTDLDRSILAIGTPLSVMFCPTRRKPEVVVAKGWYPGDTTTYGHAKNDYAACCLDTSTAQPRGVGPVTQVDPPGGKLDVTTFADVSDGTSNSLLLSEKRLNIFYLGKMVAHDNEGYTCAWNHDTLRHTNQQPRPDYNDGVNAFTTDGDRFGSSHPGGMNIALCDGSVRFMTYDISLETFKRLGNKQDGNVVQTP